MPTNRTPVPFTKLVVARHIPHEEDLGCFEQVPVEEDGQLPVLTEPGPVAEAIVEATVEPMVLEVGGHQLRHGAGAEEPLDRSALEELERGRDVGEQRTGQHSLPFASLKLRRRRGVSGNRPLLARTTSALAGYPGSRERAGRQTQPDQGPRPPECDAPRGPLTSWRQPGGPESWCPSAQSPASCWE